MPFRSSKRRSKSRSRHGRSSAPRVESREHPPPGSFPTAERKCGHDTSWTHSESSMDEERIAPLLPIETPPRLQRKQPNGNNVGESASSNGTKQPKQRAGSGSVRGRSRVPPERGAASIHSGLQSIHPADNAGQELDLLMNNVSLTDNNDHNNMTTNTSSSSISISPHNKDSKAQNKKGKYLLGKGKRSKSTGKREQQQQRGKKQVQDQDDKHNDLPRNAGNCAFRPHDTSPDSPSEVMLSFVSNASLNSSGALISSTVGLSLLADSPPKKAWNHPPIQMVRDSLHRHIQVCVDSSRRKDKDTSLPVDVDDVSFIKTGRDAVNEVALMHISDGEPLKALEILRVLLQNQRKERGTNCRAAEESEIANTKSKLSFLSLLTNHRRDAWQYATSALQTHQKAARPVHTTLSTIELGLVLMGTEQLTQALQTWREALQLACMTLGYDHFQVAVLLANLGCLHYYLGNFPASLTALEESLGLQRQLLRSNSQCTNVEMPLFLMATTMGNLALMLAQCKNYESAISLMEESLAIQESVLPTTESVKIVSEKYLDLFTQLLRDTAETEGGNEMLSNHSIPTLSSIVSQQMNIFGDSDGIPRRHNGSKHHQMARSITTTAEDDPAYDCILLGSLVNPTSSRQRIHACVVQSLETAARKQPDLNRLTSDDGASLSSSAQVRKKQSIPVDLDGEAVIDAEFRLEEINLQALDHLNRNEFKDALDLFESALRSHKDKYGDVHHLVGTGLHNCGIVHMAAEQYIQGKLCFQEAVSVRAAALGDTHPDVAASKFKVGMIQMAAGDHECALSTFMDIIFQLQMNMSTYGFAPEAKMLNNVGAVLYEMGRDVDAFQSFFKAFHIQKGLIKDDTNCAPAERALASTLSNLGFIYAKQGQCQDSLEAFQEALEILRKHPSTDYASITIVEENIAHVRAYGAVEDETGHTQSEVFASCIHLETLATNRVKHGQSTITACFSSRR